jgi:Rrf2 family protein
MHLSREGEYGLTAMILQKLVRHGLLQSFRGRQRGYSLARDASEIKVRELLEAIEGPDLFERCIFWGRRCGDSNPCVLHAGWRDIKPYLINYLETTSLISLVQNSSSDRSRTDANER